MSAASIYRTAWVLALLLGAVGCAGPQSATQAGAELADLLDWRERLLTLDSEAQRDAYLAAKAEVESRPGDLARLRLAMTLTLPQAPWRDERRLLALLGELDGAELPARRALARLLADQLREQQQRLTEERQRLGAEQQKAVREEHQRMTAERQRLLRDEQRRADELQAKLDALLKIDRQLRQKNRTR